MTIAENMRWAERTKRHREKVAARDDAAEKRANRAALYASQAAQAESDLAAEAAADRAAKLACPCCGEGRVTVEFAERVYRALERLPSDSWPDPVVLATLARIARGEVPHSAGPAVSKGLKHPTAPAAVEPSKAEKRSHSRGLSASETPDGALIEP